MLFNSFAFLFFYLPAVLAGYFWLGRHHARWPMAWLALASLFFYAYWDARYLPLLLLSIAGNYGCGRALAAARADRRQRWLMAGLAVNFGLLAYYKYANFFIDTVNGVAGAAWPAWHVVLPIGISFFTFTQVAFLVDCHRGQVGECRFTHYVLFVSYFPHLIAGPVLHHKEMMPQFADSDNHRPSAANFAVGLSILVVGLSKKILIADNLAPMVGPVFGAGAHPQLLEAWTGTLAYTFQLYFDFSGYCDMATGVSRLFGVTLPLNFNSPYKSTSISEFWRRWHMSLSRFLRDYLYIALGGSRRGTVRRYRNLMLTMLLGGLWHGAGWTFVIWGGLHGLYLVAHHAWAHAAADLAVRRARWWPLAGRAITFCAVMAAWVFFRAPDLASALDILGALLGANGVSLPHGLAPLAGWFGHFGLAPRFDGIRWIDLGGAALPALTAALLLAWCAPNTQEIFGRHQPAIDGVAPGRCAPALAWSPSKRWCMAFVLLFIACVFGMNRVTEFLYFQF